MNNASNDKSWESQLRELVQNQNYEDFRRIIGYINKNEIEQVLLILNQEVQRGVTA